MLPPDALCSTQTASFSATNFSASKIFIEAANILSASYAITSPRKRTYCGIDRGSTVGLFSATADRCDGGIASTMYPAFDWSVVLLAIMDISARASSLAERPRAGHLGHQCSHAPGRPNLHLVSSSRRPRQVRCIDLATSSQAPHFAYSLRSSVWNQDQAEAMRRRKFINLNRFWNNPAATTLVLS